MLSTEGGAAGSKPSPDLGSIDEMKRLVLSSRSVEIHHAAIQRVRAGFPTTKPCVLLIGVGEFSNQLPTKRVRPLARALQIDHLKVDYDPPEPCHRDTNRSDLVSLTFGQGEDAVRADVDLPRRCCIWIRRGELVGASELGARSAEAMKALAEALPEDSLLSAVAPCDSPPVARTGAPSDRTPALGEYVYVEELPEAREKVPPVYPEDAMRAEVSGTVMIQALVSTTGDVLETMIADSIPGLNEAAVAAVEQWHFRPARARGEPVSVWVAIPVKFSLR
jgi:TonB family protein